MRIVCQQTILMKYHALFVTLKKQQNLKLRLLQITGGLLRVNPVAKFHYNINMDSQCVSKQYGS